MNGQSATEPTSSSRFSSIHQPSSDRRYKPPPGPRGGAKMAVHCPHCEALAGLRTSRMLTPLVKELRFQCENVECGHTFVASLTIDRTICPSARPNPRIKLRMYQPQQDRPANDDNPQAAADG